MTGQCEKALTQYGKRPLHQFLNYTCNRMIWLKKERKIE